MSPTGRNLVRCGLFECQTNSIGQGFHRRGGTVHVRCGGFRVTQRPFGPHVHRHVAIQPLVIGWRQLRKHHQAEVNTRVAVALVGVDEIRDLWRACDLDMAGFALDRDGRGDVEITESVARILKNGRSGIGAIRNLRNQFVHVLVGHAQQHFDAILNGILAVFVHQRDQIAGADLTGADQGVEIPLLVAARAHVGQQHVQHVVTRLALVPDFHGGNAQTFGKNLFGFGVITCGHRTTNVGQVALAHGPEHQLALIENGVVHAGINDVATRIIGVVMQDQIAFVDVAFKETSDGLHRRNKRTKVDRNILPLQDHFRRVVEQGRGIVMRQIEHGTARGFFQSQRHFALRGFQNTTHHGQRDGVDGRCSHKVLRGCYTPSGQSCRGPGIRGNLPVSAPPETALSLLLDAACLRNRASS